VVKGEKSFALALSLSIQVYLFFLLFGLTQGSTKKVKIVIRFCPRARAGSHDNQAHARSRLRREL
jgi:hypothetical protein